MQINIKMYTEQQRPPWVFPEVYCRSLKWPVTITIVVGLGQFYYIPLLLSKEVYETSHVAIADEDDSTLAAAAQ